jgi:hypothetical protein
MDPATDWVVNGGKGALDFDGSNDQVITENRSNLGSQFTISSWVRKTTLQSQVAIAAKYQTTTNQRSWLFCTSNTTWTANGTPTGAGLGFVYSGDGLAADNAGSLGAKWTDAVSISDGAWHHACVVFNRGVIFFTVDGIRYDGLSQFSGVAAEPFNSSARWTIGAFNPDTSGTGFLLGQLDDIRIFRTALTAADARQLWQLGRGNMPMIRKRRYTEEAAGFRAYWARRQSQLIGGGV